MKMQKWYLYLPDLYDLICIRLDKSCDPCEWQVHTSVFFLLWHVDSHFARVQHSGKQGAVPFRSGYLNHTAYKQTSALTLAQLKVVRKTVYTFALSPIESSKSRNLRIHILFYKEVCVLCIVCTISWRMISHGSEKSAKNPNKKV